MEELDARPGYQEIKRRKLTSRKNDVIVKLDTIFNRTQLDRIVDNFFNWFLPVFVDKFLRKLDGCSLTGWKNISGPRKRS